MVIRKATVLRTPISTAENPKSDLKNIEQPVSDYQLQDETEELLQFGSWTWSAHDDKLYWTKGMYKLLGYTAEELIDKLTNNFYMSHVVEEDRDQLASVILNAIANKQDFEYNYQIQTKNGSFRIFSTKGKIVLDTVGKVEKVFGITRDITALKTAEKEQEKAMRDLHRSNKELEEFAYVASHDLQEPLRKVSMFTERLRAKFSGAIDKEGELFIDRILVAAENMRKLIDNLLEFSRANRSSQNFENVNLKIIIDHVLSDFELKIEETNAKINVAEPMPALHVVSTELKQVFSNLLSNALKFRNPSHQPEITIKCRKATKDEKQVHHLNVNRNFYRIDIQDNGIGFEEEYAEKIFHIFQRLHGKAEYPGSGIGLAICKKIMMNHNGVIFAQSKPEEGSTFTLILPEKQL